MRCDINSRQTLEYYEKSREKPFILGIYVSVVVSWVVYVCVCVCVCVGYVICLRKACVVRMYWLCEDSNVWRKFLMKYSSKFLFLVLEKDWKYNL